MRESDTMLQLRPWCSPYHVTHHVDILGWKEHHSPIGFSNASNMQLQWPTSQLMQVIYFKWRTTKCLFMQIKCFWPWLYAFLRSELDPGPYMEGWAINATFFVNFTKRGMTFQGWHRLWKLTFRHTPAHISCWHSRSDQMCYSSTHDWAITFICLTLYINSEKSLFYSGEELTTALEPDVWW